MAKLWNTIFMFLDVVFLLEKHQIERNPSPNHSLESRERIFVSRHSCCLSWGDQPGKMGCVHK